MHGLLAGAAAAEGRTQVAIPSRPTLAATAPGRCISKEDAQSEGRSCSLPLRSHPWLGSLCVSLQMNLFLFLCHVCQADKNILLRLPCRERKVQEKKKKKEKRQTSLLSPPPQPLAAPLRAFLLFSLRRGLANSSRRSRAHARTHNSCPAFHPF